MEVKSENPTRGLPKSQAAISTVKSVELTAKLCPHGGVCKRSCNGTCPGGHSPGASSVEPREVAPEQRQIVMTNDQLSKLLIATRERGFMLGYRYHRDGRL